MWRHTEDTCNFVNLKLPCLKELCLLWWDTNGLKFHSFFQYGNFVCVTTSLIGSVPAIFDPLDILDYTGVFQYATGVCSICKKCRTVFFSGKRHTDCVLGHCYWTVTNKSIKAQTGYMKHLVLTEVDIPAFRL